MSLPTHRAHWQLPDDGAAGAARASRPRLDADMVSLSCNYLMHLDASSSPSSTLNMMPTTQEMTKVLMSRMSILMMIHLMTLTERVVRMREAVTMTIGEW
jgi:hypothetical protein